MDHGQLNSKLLYSLVIEAAKSIKTSVEYFHMSLAIDLLICGL